MGHALNNHSTHWERIHVPEMDCSEEFQLIRKQLADVPGVSEIQADYLERIVRVSLNRDAIGVPDVIERIQALGFHGNHLTDADPAAIESAPATLKDRLVGGGGVALAAAGVCWALSGPPALSRALAILATIVSGTPVAAGALRAMRGRRVDMNVLMIVAAIGALAIGEHFEAATAMFLFGVAFWLENRSFHRARLAVRSLVDLLPQVAHRLTDSTPDNGDMPPATAVEQLPTNHIEDVHPRQLRLGERVLVRPGERFPADGVVRQGDSLVVESHLTGESLPVEKLAGDGVFAGAQNGDGALIVEVTAAAADCAATRMTELVAESRARQSPTERFVDAFARWYTPAVIAIALLIGVIVPVIMMATGVDVSSQRFISWLHRGLVLLVIACPCALVISTPVTLVCGLHRATKMGVLIKGGDCLEKLARVNAFAFDKTGTLTSGQPRVQHVDAVPPHSEADVLACAAALELHSEHPLATAIVQAARDRGAPIEHAERLDFQRGRGVSGMWRDAAVALGSQRFMAEMELEPNAFSDSQMEHSVATPLVMVYTAWQGALMGRIGLADTVRADAGDCMRLLKQLDADSSLTMLTGDRREVAEAIGRQVGIEDVRSDLLPADKIAAIRALKQHAAVGMVGDGINDGPALIEADVGFAMGRGATDLALDAADIVVLSPHLVRVPQAVALAEATRAVLWQNISLALGIKGVVLVITAMGMGSMWLAVAADVGASLIVVANGMKLLRYPLPGRGGNHASTSDG